MRKVTKGRLGDVTFQFNPSEMTYNLGGVWTNINSPGMNQPIPVFSHGTGRVIRFELWVNKRSQQPVDVKEVYDKLDQYRGQKRPVLFAYGHVVRKVIIEECVFIMNSWDNELNNTEMTIPITLREVGKTVGDKLLKEGKTRW